MSVVIAKYTPADLPELRSVFREAGKGEPPLFGDADEDIWLLPYIQHQPNCIHLARTDSRLVGYLTGCINSASMPSEESRVIDTVRRRRLWRKPTVAALLMRSMWDSLLSRGQGMASELHDCAWPAHVHVRLVPDARGFGIGTALMRSWQHQLSLAGVPGCHLHVQTENHQAVPFFTRMGFVPYGRPALIPGLRDHRGHRLHQLTMVWSAPVP